MKFYRKCIHIAIWLPFFFSSCSFFNNTEELEIITVGKKKITVAEFKKDIRRLSMENDRSGQNTIFNSELWLNQIIDHYLILEYGRENGIQLKDEEVESEIKKIKNDIPEEDFNNILLQGYIDFAEWKEILRQQVLINKIVKKVLENITLDYYDEIKQYYESHSEEFKHLSIVKFRQIVTRTKAQAEDLYRKIDQGADMAVLAKQNSITPEAKNGGEVDWIEKGTLEISLEQAIFSLPVGKMSPVISSPYGFHIIKLLAVRKEGVRSLPEVRKEIETKLLYQKRETFYRDWLSQLHHKYPVKVNYELLKTLELKP